MILNKQTATADIGDSVVALSVNETGIDTGPSITNSPIIALDLKATSPYPNIPAIALRATGNIVINNGSILTGNSSVPYNSAFGGYIFNWNFELGTPGWILTGYSTIISTVTDGKVGKGVLSTSNSLTGGALSNEYIPCGDNTKTYSVSGWFRRFAGSSAGKTIYLAVALFDVNLNAISGDTYYWYQAASNVAPTFAWTKYTGFFGNGTAKPLPATAKYMRLAIALNYGSTGDYQYQCQALRIDDVERIIMPLSATIAENTTYTVPSDVGKSTVFIPAAYLTASSGGPYTLTLQTSAVGANVVYIPIIAQGIPSTVSSGNLVFSIYVDASGNVASDYFEIDLSSAGNPITFVVYKSTGQLTQKMYYPSQFSQTTIPTGNVFTNSASVGMAVSFINGSQNYVVFNTGAQTPSPMYWTASVIGQLTWTNQYLQAVGGSTNDAVNQSYSVYAEGRWR